MCQKEYYHLAEQLGSIRLEIKGLRRKRATSIMDKIKLLKEINDLLSEQNKLLTLRQEVLAGRQLSDSILIL